MDPQTDNNQQPATPQTQPTTPPVTQPASNAATGEQIVLTPQALNDRLKRAEKSALNRLLKELGLDSIDTAKAKLGGQPNQPAPETNSELDELRQTLEQLKAESEQLKAEKEKAEQLRRDGLVNDAIKTAVKGVKYPDDVVTLIRGNRSIDLSKALKEDGNIDTTVITAAIEEARKSRPEWFAPTTPGSPSNFGGTPPQIDQKKKEAAKQAQAAYAKRGF
jgi:ATP-dependent Clp protease ATP-binding subunit ClpA